MPRVPEQALVSLHFSCQFIASTVLPVGISRVQAGGTTGRASSSRSTAAYAGSSQLYSIPAPAPMSTLPQGCD